MSASCTTKIKKIKTDVQVKPTYKTLKSVLERPQIQKYINPNYINLCIVCQENLKIPLNKWSIIVVMVTMVVTMVVVMVPVR